MNLSYFAENYFFSTNVPTIIFDTKKESLLRFPSKLYQPTDFIIGQLKNTHGEWGYFLYRELCYYGYIKKKSSFFVWGPIFSFPVTDNRIESFIKKKKEDISDYQEIKHLFTMIPVITFNQLLKQIQLNYYSLTGKKCNLDIEHLSDNLSDNNLESTLLKNKIETKETENYHNTYYFEQTYLEYIRRGNYFAVKEYLSNYTVVHDKLLACIAGGVLYGIGAYSNCL